MSAFESLMAYQRETQALAQIAGRLNWDQETMMPRGSAEQRAEECAALEGVLHARQTNPQVADWLEEIDGTGLSEADQSKLRLIKRSYDRSTKVPAELASRLARELSASQGAWADARANDDMAAYQPVLEKVVALRREEAAALAEGGDLYDALLNDYEPDAKASDIEAMFNALRPGLVELREAVLAQPAPQDLDFKFNASKQMKLARHIAKTFGYDMNRGRVDKAVHPFSSGGGDDVRITTRTSEADPFNCIYSTIHEVGHAAYEQNVDPDYRLTPLGQGVSMGVHESQSRIYENQLGRSRAFTGWLYGQMRDVFGDFGVSSEDEFYRTVNSIRNGYIRTEADEVQYNLHVMLRFDLERALIAGTLEVADLEGAWNDRFLADFGYEVDKASNGVMQDVHWAVGLMGYFPTYSLGNVYSGCLYQAMREQVSGLDDALTKGDTTLATTWLRENLQQHGSLRTPTETIKHACGFDPSEAPLLGYLKEKFSGIYQL